MLCSSTILMIAVVVVVFVASAQAFTTPQAQPHVGLGSHERRFELLPNSCALSLLSKGSKKKFGAVELGLHKRRPSDNDEKNDGMTLWDHFKAEFKFSEQVQSYFINLVTVSLGAYIALLLLSDAVKFRQMGLGML
mmetsp:Transcript_39746/g.93483  ORF Transcript_39746/g.93483 Transcript_39746/m.93483 type:complete len:136 (+) Transcript_39746:145-552(+)